MFKKILIAALLMGGLAFAQGSIGGNPILPDTLYNGDTTIVASETGRVFLIRDLTANTTFDMPAEAAGLWYEFVYVGGVADTHDHTFDTGADVNYFIGGVSFLDSDAGDAADEVHLGLFSDGNSNSKFTINNITAGTRVLMVCNGTNWYISGVVVSDTVPAFADQ
jgi:hypothetical protein